jgi:hypothetical protein
MKHFTTVAALGAAVIVATGCGGEDSGTPSVPRTTAAAEAPDPTVELERAAIDAVEANARLAQQVAWTNRVPASATESTRGVALSNMRHAAAENAKAGVRVKTIDASTRVLSVAIDPSFGQATARVVAVQQLRIYRRGRTSQSRRLTERATIVLKRLGRDEPARFVVWSVR